MKNTVAGICACLIASVTTVLGNGGGYDRGGLESAGDVAGFEPKHTEKIRILDEKLTVLLGPKSADVEVRYLMRNETAAKVKVRFGFPVEESFDGDRWESVGDVGKVVPDGKTLRYCRDYQVTAAGRPVSAKWQVEKQNDDKRFRGVAGWLVSELSFAAGEEKPVMIRFRSDYPFSQYSVSEDVSESCGLFKYRLSTAACWAGMIGSGTITLKPAGIRPEEMKVIKPVNRFKKEGDTWVWRFENLEPTLADDFEVEAVPATETYYRPAAKGEYEGPWLGYIKRGEKWSMSHSNYRVTASSTLAPEGGHKYDAENIKNPSDENMWSEGAPGPGAGEWLELTPEVPKPLLAITLRPGCWKSHELFTANARPKKVLVELNGEHRFHAEVRDAMEEIEIPVIGYGKPVKKLRLIFEEVWPGKRFEDLCVSSVRLHVRLDKDPKIQPAR